MRKIKCFKNRMKAVFIAALTVASALAVTACGTSEDGPTSVIVNEVGGEKSSETDNGDEGNSTVNKSADDGTVRESLTALEVTELMGNGINLGNTMEAYGRSALGTDAQPSQYETYWGLPGIDAAIPER